MSEENKAERLSWSVEVSRLRAKLHDSIDCTKAQADCIFQMELAVTNYLLKIKKDNVDEMP